MQIKTTRGPNSKNPVASSQVPADVVSPAVDSPAQAPKLTLDKVELGLQKVGDGFAATGEKVDDFVLNTPLGSGLLGATPLGGMVVNKKNALLLPYADSHPNVRLVAEGVSFLGNAANVLGTASLLVNASLGRPLLGPMAVGFLGLSGLAGAMGTAVLNATDK